VYLFTMCDPANQQADAGSAADAPKDDPNEPWGDEPDTEGGEK